MEKNYFLKKVLQACMLFFLIITANVSAQVGIGTITPHASSVLDVSSTTQGMLTPRMTTSQRTAIGSPADGLMVYDTDLKSFYHFTTGTSSWNGLNSVGNGRLKFKRIKSTDVLATVLAAEKVAGGNKYLLYADTYYEINGTIILDFPIDLNNAYVSGQDANEDKLVRTSGNLFDGATGGSIRNVSIQVTGGKVFNLNGPATQNLIIRDAIITSSSDVGSITGFGLVFVSTVQYIGNTTGIVYETISKLLISNAAWFSNNTGTYEKVKGTFDLVQKQGGFSEVSGTAIGFDVSSNPTITGDAVLETVVFTGTVSTGKYVNGYSNGGYTGYNFDNNWNVRCAGIPNETDATAVGEFTIDYPVGGGLATNFSANNPSNSTKVLGVSTSTNLFRFSTGSTDNKLVYLGKKKRFFQVTGSISFQVSNPGTYVIYIVKNDTIVTKYKIYGQSSVANDVIVLPLNALVELTTNDYVEVHAKRHASTLITDSIKTPNMTLVLK